MLFNLFDSPLEHKINCNFCYSVMWNEPYHRGVFWRELFDYFPLIKPCPFESKSKSCWRVHANDVFYLLNLTCRQWLRKRKANSKESMRIRKESYMNELHKIVRDLNHVQIDRMIVLLSIRTKLDTQSFPYKLIFSTKISSHTTGRSSGWNIR